MSSASYEVLSCTTNDSSGIAENNVSAFWQQTWWNMLWPGKTRDSLIKAVEARTPKNLITDRDIRRHQKVMDKASNKVVGYARWILPDSHKDSWLAARIPEVTDSEREKFVELHAAADWTPREDMDDLDDHVHELKAKYKNDRCLELDYLATHPDCQRKGVASMLVSSGIREAQKSGVDVFVPAMGRHALGLYLKHGFELLEQKSQSLKPYGVDEDYETFFLIKRH
ncbi:hypothetical protein FSARC_14331 [Fusarium sarcochroum]|uniref:N-acetyltransferase domain-containing protein n=1 Tax=Fusarium sarcochroum TaxID=1208366 RepID=A0A8H4SUI2_9HYPO|nr:hypothetical protein FSARC_14331 [Fusarium sarcochroum]